MKKQPTILLSILTVFWSFFNPLYAQTGPSFPDQDSLRVFVNSGLNQILFNVEDENAVSVSAVSSDPALLEINEIFYEEGDQTTVIEITEKGITGVVSVTITTQTNDGSSENTWDIHITNYNNPGIQFEVHDIVFWQEAIPLTESPVFDTIIQTGEGPYEHLNYDNIPLTVNMDCNDSPPCTGHDFFTSFYRGYLVPPADGTYHLYIQSENRHILFFSDDENFDGAEMVAARSENHGNIGEETGNGTTRSVPLELEGGKVYAMYGTQWIIHNTYGGLLWDGPGIEMEFIPGEHTMPLFDVQKPSSPQNLDMLWRGSSEIMVSWDSSSDNNQVEGYNIYVNGLKNNELPIDDTSYLIEGLTPGTNYEIIITAQDKAGNESYVSNLLYAQTHIADDAPPSPPNELTQIAATGLAMHLQWSGAQDNETEVIAYNIYIDDVLYNTEQRIFDDEVIIYGLMPETSYEIKLEAFDAGFNPSELSQPFEVATTVFDPLGESLGEKRGRIVIHDENISWNEGIGINGPYSNGDMVNDQQIRDLVKKMGAGTIRWGAIDANSKSFAQSTGTGKENTYARMLDFAMELDAFFSLTVGVEPGIDYRTDPDTFLHLLEYLAGDESTTYGAIRAAEGFTEPLLQNSKGILLEFGNEVWGGEAHNAEFEGGYEVYAQWARDMSEVVKSSPYYDPEKITMVYSGRYPHPSNSYGVNTQVLTGDRGEISSLGVSGYLGGNLSYDPEIPQGESELDYYKNGIERSAFNMEGFVLTMKESLQLTGTLKSFYLYESNMTTSSYNGRFGQAITMTDYMAGSMLYGSVVPSIFHLTGGQWRITRPSENYRELPLFTTAQYFNRFCKGHILKTAFISNNVITNHNDQAIDWEPVGAYAFNKGEDFAFLLINRDFEDQYTIQVDLPESFNLNSTAKMYTIWNNDFSSYDAYIDSTDITLSDGMFVSVPKHAMILIASQGDDPQFTQLPQGYFERKRPDHLEVFTDGDGNITEDKQSVLITAVVTPDDAFSTAAIYDIVENTTESRLFFLSGNRLRITGSGIEGDEGHLTIKVYAADNQDLQETITVNVSNQGPVSVDEITKAEKDFYFPNPARKMVHILDDISENAMVELYDINGRKALSHSLSDGYSINLEELDPGMYFIQILFRDGTVRKGKLQIN